MVVCYTGKNVLFLEIITFNYQGQNTKSLSSSNIYKCKEPFLYFAPNSFLTENKKKRYFATICQMLNSHCLLDFLEITRLI